MSPERRAWNYDEGHPEMDAPWRKGLPNELTEEQRGRAASRLSFIIVCRRWYELSIGLLYQYVPLFSPRSFESFARAIIDSAKAPVDTGSSSPQEAPHLGDFVKYLYLFLSGPAWCDDTLFDPSAFATCLRHLRNIKVLVLSTEVNEQALPRERYRTIASPIEMALGPVVRYIRRTTFYPPHFESIRHFDRIEALSINIIQVPHPFERCCFPNLHTLELLTPRLNYMISTQHLGWMTSWEMPSLRRVYVPTFFSVEKTIPLFRHFGTSITAVSLNPAWEDGVPLLLPHLPSLREVAVGCESLSDLLPVMPGLVGIKVCIGRRRWSKEGYNNRQDVGFMMAKLNNGMATLLANHGPHFKCLRIIEPSLAELASQSELLWDSKYAEMWEEWIIMWKAKDVRFEFDTGDPVELPHTVSIAPVTVD
jgi:hypothetical protein